jgi:hypothetical protein
MCRALPTELTPVLNVEENFWYTMSDCEYTVPLRYSSWRGARKRTKTPVDNFLVTMYNP